MKQFLSSKTAAGIINNIRDKHIKQLTREEIEALILAENIIRENPELVKNYLK